MRIFNLILLFCFSLNTTFVLAQSKNKLILPNKYFATKIYRVDAKNLPTKKYNTHLKPNSANSSPQIIGNTTYDLQTTGSMPRRINVLPNGKLSTTWVASSQDNTYSDLGTNYNFYDGSNWGAIPTNRIESTRTTGGGLNQTSTGEISIASPMSITKKSNVNTNWDSTRIEQKFEHLDWPRTASVGDTIYTIFGSNSPDSISGFKSPIYFTRSIDGGLTFSTPSALFAQMAGYDTINHTGDVGPDHYAIDAYGSTVAILILGVTEDVIVLKSIDYGVTWTKTIVQEFPIHKYSGGITDTNANGICDTIMGVTGDGSIVIDHEGGIHIVYSDLLLSKCDSTDITIFPIYKSDYFKYWNEKKKLLGEIPVLEDLNGNGIFDVGSNFTSTIRYGNSGYSFHPTLSISKENYIFFTYAATTEEDTTNFGEDYHNVYSIVTNGIDWCLLGSISNTTSQENVFPTTPNRLPYSWGDFYIQWQQDFDPGLSVNGAHSTTFNDIMFYTIDLNILSFLCFTGIERTPSLNHKLYPNPASSSIVLELDVAYSMSVSVQVINTLGQVMLEKQSELSVGVNKEYLDTSMLLAGIYTVLIQSNNSVSYEKIIIK